MPVYEYRCKSCGRTHELEHGFHDKRPTSCPACGGHLVRVFHPVGVVFKGSGFHKTDYTSSGLRKEAVAKDAGATDGGKADAKAGAASSEPAASAARESSSPGKKTAPASTEGKPPAGSSTP